MEIVNIIQQLVITSEDIDDIMLNVLGEGVHSSMCTWYTVVVPAGGCIGERIYNQISLDGQLVFYQAGEQMGHLLTKKKLIQGIKMYVENPVSSDIVEVIDHELRIDHNMIDEEVADAIVQYALFADLIYGVEN